MKKVCTNGSKVKVVNKCVFPTRYESVLVFYDMKIWRSLPVPQPPDGTIITSVHKANNSTRFKVYTCGKSRLVLKPKHTENKHAQIYDPPKYICVYPKQVTGGIHKVGHRWVSARKKSDHNARHRTQRKKHKTKAQCTTHMYKDQSKVANVPTNNRFEPLGNDDAGQPWDPGGTSDDGQPWDPGGSTIHQRATSRTQAGCVKSNSKKMKTLKAAVFNARSVNNKTPEINFYLRQHDLDLVMIVESWQDPENSEHVQNLAKLRGNIFDSKQTPRLDMGGGGILVLHRKGLNVRKIRTPKVKTFEMMEILVSNKEKKLRFVIIYRPESSPKHQYACQSSMMNSLR